MKKVLFMFIFISLALFSYSQSKTELGVTTEGSWFMPHQTNGRDWATKAGFGTGIGIYASRNIFWRFSADIGLSYSYKQMEQHYVIYKDLISGYNNDGISYGDIIDSKVEGWEKYPLHYVVIPVHLQLLTGKYLFIRGGIEASWLTNYESGNEKGEYNWTAGFGSQKYKLKWSVNYIRGFKEVGFVNGLFEIENGKYRSATIYRNQMIQLNISYPIWQNK